MALSFCQRTVCKLQKLFYIINVTVIYYRFNTIYGLFNSDFAYRKLLIICRLPVSNANSGFKGAVTFWD